MPEISELNGCSFKSDQASIADWLELFEKNEYPLVNAEADENFFRIINNDQLFPQTSPVELVAMNEDESRLGEELDRAFIHEHSEINLQGPSLLEEAEVQDSKLNFTQVNIKNTGTFSITAMLEKNGPMPGRRTLHENKASLSSNDQEESKGN